MPNLKSYKQFLNERPLDPEATETLNQLKDVNPKRFDTQKIVDTMIAYADRHPDPDIQAFNKKGLQGEFRKIALVTTNADVFTPEQKQNLDHPLEQRIPTIIKITKLENDPKNYCNYSEVSRWYKINSEYPALRDYLCPIIDNSVSILTGDKEINEKWLDVHREDIFFVQMPRCITWKLDDDNASENKAIEEKVIEEYGNFHYFIEKLMPKVYDYYDPKEYTTLERLDFFFRHAIPEHLKIDKEHMRRDYYTQLSPKQIRNVNNLIKLYRVLSLNDIHLGNVGIYRGRLVILDYGLNAYNTGNDY